jgi:hypothetical protein
MLPNNWQATQQSVHRWTQIVGKLRLALSPQQNHFWHTALYVSSTGLSSSPIPWGSELFQVDFDFLAHQLKIVTSWGPSAAVALAPRTVADFYAETMSTLRGLGIDVAIWSTPVETADTLRFEQDSLHAAYDPAAAQAMWRVLIQADRVFKIFRGRFLGKSSPVHFFWGAFDLAVTRFSGRRAPLWQGTALNVHPHVMHESYSHEVSSAGLWLGNSSGPPMFYSYAVPEPPGFKDAAVVPTRAAYSTEMGEFVLPYDVVRDAANPDQALMAFLESTYNAAADLGGWDRELLEHRPICQCTLGSHV